MLKLRLKVIYAGIKLLLSFCFAIVTAYLLWHGETPLAGFWLALSGFLFSSTRMDLIEMELND